MNELERKNLMKLAGINYHPPLTRAKQSITKKIVSYFSVIDHLIWFNFLYCLVRLNLINEGVFARYAFYKVKPSIRNLFRRRK